MADMRLFFSKHALAAMRERGVSRSEVEETVAAGERRSAKGGRSCAEKVFAFDAIRFGQYYAKKKVRVIFEERDGSINVITVIGFFF